MKERPILFSGDMVRSLLDGRKTQTRRVVKYPVKQWAFCPDYNGGDVEEYRQVCLERIEKDAQR